MKDRLTLFLLLAIIAMPISADAHFVWGHSGYLGRVDYVGWNHERWTCIINPYDGTVVEKISFWYEMHNIREWAVFSPSERMILLAEEIGGDPDNYYVFDRLSKVWLSLPITFSGGMGMKDDRTIAVAGYLSQDSIVFEGGVFLYDIYSKQTTKLHSIDSSEFYVNSLFVQSSDILFSASEPNRSGIWRYTNGQLELLLDSNQYQLGYIQLLGCVDHKLYFSSGYMSYTRQVYAFDLQTNELIQIFQGGGDNIALNPNATTLLLEYEFYYNVLRNLHPVPEPSTMVVLASGMGAMLLRWRKVKR